MTDTENAALESTGLARMFDVYKRNRPIQIASVVFVVALISIPIHSYLTAPPADEYQRELEYIVDGEYGVIAWIAETTVELSDGEVFSLTFTEQDFPDEAKNSNVFSVDFYVGVQFHPEFKSRPGKPSPPFLGLLKAATGQLNG